MDTSRPEWAKIGQLVAVNGAWWYGEIVDVAVSDTGRVMLLLTSPKSVWHGHAPEWLEYSDPEQIRPVDKDEAARDINRISESLDAAKDRVKEMGKRWGL